MQLRRLFTRSHSRIALTAAVVALSGAVVAHHTPIDVHGMPDMTATMICLGVLGAATLVAVALNVLPRVRPRPPTVGILRALWIPPTRGTPARAGPLYLRLQVLRR